MASTMCPSVCKQVSPYRHPVAQQLTCTFSESAEIFATVKNIALSSAGARSAGLVMSSVESSPEETTGKGEQRQAVCGVSVFSALGNLWLGCWQST